MHNKLANSHSPSKLYTAGLAVPVRELHAGHRAEILRHLLLLNEEDRRLRFGTQTPDEVIHHSSAQVQQFVQGLADGPVTFHYPAKNYKEELLGDRAN